MAHPSTLQERNHVDAIFLVYMVPRVCFIAFSSEVSFKLLLITTKENQRKLTQKKKKSKLEEVPNK